MSEPDTPNQVFDLVDTGRNEVHGSPGRLLRAAREAAGIHTAALAGSLKIPISRLEALENDDFSALPDAVFARALASSICRTLDLDPVAVLKLMPKNEIFSFSPTGPGLNASFKDGSRKIGKNSFLEHAKRPISISVVILLLGVLILLFVPFGSESPVISDKNMRNNWSTPESQAVAVSTQPAPVASESVITEAVMPAVVAPVTVDSSAPAANVTISKLASEIQEPVVHTELLQFRALGESWVQVRDATKNVVFERTLAKGQIFSATGALPLTVVVGRADATEVLVRGKLFELTGVAKENVARFEVKQ